MVENRQVSSKVRCMRIKVTPLKEKNVFNRHVTTGYQATAIGYCGICHQAVSDTKHHAELELKAVVGRCPECQEMLREIRPKPVSKMEFMV